MNQTEGAFKSRIADGPETGGGAWKLPLPLLIDHFYLKRFGRERPACEISWGDGIINGRWISDTHETGATVLGEPRVTRFGTGLFGGRQRLAAVILLAWVTGAAAECLLAAGGQFETRCPE